MINTLYLIHAQICREEVNVATDIAGELQHKRLFVSHEREGDAKTC